MSLFPLRTRRKSDFYLKHRNGHNLVVGGSGTAVPSLFGNRDKFHGRQFSQSRGGRMVSGCFECMPPYHTLFLLFYPSPSNYQALDPGELGTLEYCIGKCGN